MNEIRTGRLMSRLLLFASISGLSILYFEHVDASTGLITDTMRRPFLSKSAVLPGLPNDAGIEIPAGSTICWKFSLKLPLMIPPSFERGTFKRLTYSIGTSVVLGPRGAENTLKVHVPFRVCGPAPPHHAAKSKTHSFLLSEKGDGIRVVSENSQQHPLFVSVHFDLPPEGYLAVGQENPVVIRFFAAEGETANEADAIHSLAIGDNSDGALSLAAPLIGAGAEKRPSIVRFMLHGLCRMFLPGDSSKLTWNKSVELKTTVLHLPLELGSRSELKLIVPENLKPTLHPDQSEFYHYEWKLHVHINMGFSLAEAVMPVVLFTTPPPTRVPSAYPQGERALKVELLPNTISIPVAYPQVSGDKWKVFSGPSAPPKQN